MTSWIRNRLATLLATLVTLGALLAPQQALAACLDPNCSYNGTCVGNTCQCNQGWSGATCATSTACGSCPSCNQGQCSNGICYCAPGNKGSCCDSGANLPVTKRTPQALDFGARAVGSSSEAHTVTFTVLNYFPYSSQNAEPEPGYTIGAIALLGAHPADFSLGGTCAVDQTILPPNSCTVTVRFNPGAPGARSAELYIAQKPLSTPYYYWPSSCPLHPGSRLETLPESEVYFQVMNGSAATGHPFAELAFNFEHLAPLDISNNNAFSARFVSSKAGDSKDLRLTITGGSGTGAFYSLFVATPPLPITLSGVGVAAPQGSTSSIVIDPSDARKLYTGIDGAGVYMSDDSGVTWSAAATQPTNNRVKALAMKSGTPEWHLLWLPVVTMPLDFAASKGTRDL